jgi:hypothetical protein
VDFGAIFKLREDGALQTFRPDGVASNYSEQFRLDSLPRLRKTFVLESNRAGWVGPVAALEWKLGCIGNLRLCEQDL